MVSSRRKFGTNNSPKVQLVHVYFLISSCRNSRHFGIEIFSSDMSYERAFVRLLYCLSINYFLNLKVTFNQKFTPFAYPRLYQIVDKQVGMKYFCKKLGVNGFLTDRLILKHAQPYLDWQKEFEVVKETVRNIDACSLLKTEPRSRAYDLVDINGNKECLKQCKVENALYYQYLNNKLQKLIRRTSYRAEVRLIDRPVDENNGTVKDFYKCVKKGYKRYACQCTYHPNYVVETSDRLKKTFHEILEELYGLSPSPDNCKMLEERYRISLKLIGFLVSCHLLPKEIFTFLVWWDLVEDAPTQQGTALASDEESESISEAENEETEETEEAKEAPQKRKQFILSGTS